MEELKQGRINEGHKSLGNLVRTVPHLIASTVMTPIAFPYGCLALFGLTQFRSPDDGYSADCVHNFLENDKLTNFWEDGFRKFGKAVKQYIQAEP